MRGFFVGLFFLVICCLLPAGAELQLGQVAADKILYDPGATAQFTVVVKNPDGAPANATLAVWLEHDLAVRDKLVEQAVSVGANGVFTWKGSAKLSPVLGMALTAELSRDGTVFVEKSDVFNCARNVHQVLICGRGDHSGWQFSGMIDKSLKTYPNDFAGQYRGTYGNFIEKFGWAPSDFDELTPSVDRWWAGQTGYNESKTNMKAMIDAFHAQGFKVVTYGKAAACGIAGFARLRRRPDLATYVNGRFASENYDAAVLDYQAALGPPHFGEGRMVPDAPEKMEASGYTGVGKFQPFTRGLDWCSIWYDCGTPEVADIAIGELAGSATMFGFDGVRFDGEFWAGRSQTLDGSYNVPENTDFMKADTALVKKMKAVCWAAMPGYIFGYNAGTDITWSVGRKNTPPNFREKCKDDGLIANEGYAFPGDIPWSDYCKRLRREQEIVRYYGGHYATYGFNRGGGNLYNFIYQYALRAHVMNPLTIAETYPWVNRSATRYSGLLWDDGISTWHAAAQSVSVAGSGPVAWQEFAAMDDAPGGGTRYILHLFNPPASATVGGKDQLPAKPLTGVTVNWTGPADVTGAWVVDMEKTAAAPVTPANGVFDIGDITYWKILVVDVTTPRPAPTYDEPPADAKRTGPSAADLQIAPTARPDNTLWRHVQEPEQWGGGEDTAEREADPDALNGGACVGKPSRPTGSMASTYQYLRTPGRYKATFRLKVDNNTVDEPVFTLSCARGNSFPGLPALFADGKTLKATDFAKANVYQEFTIEFDYADYGFTGIGATYLGHVQGFWDRTTLELIKPWTTAELAAHYAGFTRPEGLTLTRDGVLDVLAVRGLYNRLYHLDEAIVPAGGRLTDAYTAYHQQRGTTLSGYKWDWQDFWKQDVIILTNVETKGLNYGQVLMLGEWVKDGGGLLILGGNLTLGQDDNMRSGWPQFLPVNLTGPWEVRKCQPPVIVAGSIPQSPQAVMYRHMVTPKPGATVLLKGSKGEPLLVGGTYGKGRVAVFTGTVLGEAPEGMRNFWDTLEWVQQLRKAIGWVARKE